MKGQPADKMGTKSSMLLQEEEIEEIQRETGCKFQFQGIVNCNIVCYVQLDFPFGHVISFNRQLFAIVFLLGSLVCFPGPFGSVKIYTPTQSCYWYAV